MLCTRRQAIVAATGGSAFAGIFCRSATAAAPPTGIQAPGVHRFRVGRFEVTALLDGHLDLGLELFPGARAEAVELLGKAFLSSSGPVRTSVNAFAVNTGDRLYLIDAGTNAGYLPTLGKLLTTFAAANIVPTQVDMLLVTHLHPDHVGGASRDGDALFSSAELVVPEADAAFWLDPATEARAPAELKPLFGIAHDASAPYAASGRLRRLDTATRTVAPGIEAVPLPGHTPGHSGYLIRDSGEALLIWGDVVHAAALQLPRPETAIVFDVDQSVAVQTRQRILDQVASERMRVAGMHLPFPGVGHIAKDGQGYAFVPDPFLPL